MTNHELSSMPEKRLAEFKIVQFKEGELALSFEGEGFIPLGPNSKFKYTKSFGPEGNDFVILRTKSGNAYGVGGGVIMNHRDGSSYPIAEELPEVLKVQVHFRL
jgi:uncharacterized protein YbaR (Trm112 family)